MVTPAAMAYIIGALRSEIRVPFGVDAISDGAACLELAAAVGASYVRGTFSGVYVGDGGLYNNDFSALLRRKAALPLDDLKMLYFINPESDRNLDTRPLADIAASTMSKAAPDGLCISANAAGMDVDEELIASVKAANPEVVVLCNTGCRPDTIVRKLQAGDAAVVGTYFKENGKLENSRHENVRVDLERVREFMAVVYRFRETL
jgi:membrane complex biogenesis BtpA family protein